MLTDGARIPSAPLVNGGTISHLDWVCAASIRHPGSLQTPLSFSDLFASDCL